MFKLMKWIAVGAAAVAGAGLFLFGGHAFSYFSTAANSIRDGIREQVPIEFELKRAEALIEEIEPQITDGKRQVAQAEVNLENLQNDIDLLEARAGRSERKLKAVSAKLGSGDSSYKLASYERQRVEFDLERTFESHKNDLAILKGKRALIERQTRALIAAKQHLDAVRSKKAQLEDLIGQLKVQKAQLDALAASSTKIDLDDTALGKAAEVLDNVKNRLDVAQHMIEDDIFFGESIETEKPQTDVVSEIQAYFAEQDAMVGDALLETR